MSMLAPTSNKAKFLDRARHLFEQAREKAGQGDLKQAADLIVRGLNYEHRAARLEPQVLKVIKLS